MDKRVSILIPVYNGEKTIKDTIESAIAQTYDNIEIVIIDNKSTDGTVNVVKSFDDSRISFYQNSENLGMVGNWNECLKKATGDYLHFLCADDKLNRDCIEKKVSAMLENNAVMVISATDIVNDNDELVMHRAYYKNNQILDGYKYAKKSLHRGNIYGEPSSVMFDRAVIDKTGFFATNLSYTTDWELWCRISTCGRLVYLSEVLSQYRISMSNTTGSLKLSRIMKDDTLMIQNLQKYPEIRITLADIIIHKIVLTIRDVVRVLYMRIKSK